MEQFYCQLKLGFEIVTGTQSVNSKVFPGSSVNFEGVTNNIFKGKNNSRSFH
jgi:hypothetical protein